VLRSPTRLAYEWYALVASGCICGAGRRAHFLAGKGDISGSVDRDSLGDLELRMTLGGAAASTKAVWWDLHLESLLTHFLL